MHLPVRVLSRDGKSILRSQETLTRGFSVHMLIRGLSRDGQSILDLGILLQGGWCNI